VNIIAPAESADQMEIPLIFLVEVVGGVYSSRKA